MGIYDTGFVSQEQENYLMKNEPTLYKAVLKKHGSFRETKKRPNPNVRVDNRSALPNISRGRRRGN